MKLINQQGDVVEVDLKNVLHIEKDVKNSRTLFHTARTVYHDPSTLKEMEAAYKDQGFHRIDKNRLINLDKVDRQERGFLFIGSAKYSVSRRNEVIIRKLLEHL